MFARLNNISIRNRLFLIVLIAILATLSLGLPRLSSNLDILAEANQISAGVDLAKSASALVHELQKERGNSAGYIGSKGATSFRSNLDTQKRATDPALVKFQEIAASSLIKDSVRSELSQITADLNKLTGVRQSVAGLTATVPQMAGYYTGTIRKLLGLFTRITSEASDPGIVARGTALAMLLESKERAGLERAMGANGFGAGKFPPAIAANFDRLIAQQQAFDFGFNRFASAGFKTALERILSSPESLEVNRLRKIAQDSFKTGDTQGIAGTVWFGTITQKIDLLYGLETNMVTELVEHSDDIGNAGQTAFTATLIFLFLLFLGLVALALLLSESIRRPLYRLMDQTDLISKGEYDGNISFLESKSEIGSFARNLNDFRTGLKQTEDLRLQKEEEDRRAQLEKERAAQEEHKRELQEKVRAQKTIAEQQRAVSEGLQDLANTVETELASLIENVLQVARETSESGRTLSSSTSSVSSSVDSVQTSVSNASHNSQSVASAAEELNASISEITRQVEATQGLVETTSQEAEEISSALGGLTDAANNIASVTTIIGDIAEQTNLLALNATIEAARAGDAGKGFAVVASEVKSLASQTGTSSGEIGQFVQEMQSQVSTTVDRINQIVDRMNQVSERSNAVSAAVIEQSATTQEIARSIQTASLSVDEVSQQVTDVQAETGLMVEVGETIGSATHRLEEAIQGLQDRMQAVIADTRRKSDRRALDRQDLDAHTSIELTADNWGLEGTIADFSPSGLRVVHTPEALTGSVAVDDIISVKMNEFALDASVVWVNDGTVGVMFLDKLSAAPFYEFLSELSEETGTPLRVTNIA